LAVPDNLQVVERIAMVGKEHGNRFACVQHAASPEPNNEIAHVLAGKLRAPAGHVGGRLADNVEDSVTDLVVVEDVQQGGCSQRRTAYDNQCPLPEFCYQWPRVEERPGPKNYSRSRSKFKLNAVSHRNSYLTFGPFYHALALETISP
jgi:hypothetical protein